MPHAHLRGLMEEELLANWGSIVCIVCKNSSSKCHVGRTTGVLGAQKVGQLTTDLGKRYAINRKA